MICFGVPLYLAQGGTGTPSAQQGFLRQGEKAVLPIGWYEMPKSEIEWWELAEAGVNLVRCRGKADLDRAQAAGLLGWVPLPLSAGAGAGSGLRDLVRSVVDHPALAVWEGPDEVVWNFTAYSGLFRSGVYKSADEWWQQTPLAVARSEGEAARILPLYREGIRLVRELDRGRRLRWLNEAAGSDLKFVREFLVGVDITGCDIYPIHDTNRRPWLVGQYTERYKRVGQGRPVWMVLQGFSWHELKPPKDKLLAYPSFVESRLMAWSALAHGARGLLYWGTEYVPAGSPFRGSLLALVSELKAVQPFLVAEEESDMAVELIEVRDGEGGRGVRVMGRRAGSDWLVALVNEDDAAHMGVEVSGLKGAEGREFWVLYGVEKAVVRDGIFCTRLKPFEVKLFATGSGWESGRNEGREFK